MSQSGKYTNGSPAPGTVVETLSGNTGGAVSPSGGNINVVGDGIITFVTGAPATHTLEITLSSSVPIDFETDSGTAIPTANTLIITGATTGLIFDASGNTVGLAGTLDVAFGGTGNNAVVAYAPIVGGTGTTTPFQSANTGISNSGWVLTSTGVSSVPAFEALPASSISITGDTGGALTGNSFTFHGGTTGLSFGGSGTTETLTFAGITANAGIVNLGTDSTNNTINIGTAANTGRTINIGNATGTTAIFIDTGSGGLNVTDFSPGAVVATTGGLLESITGTAGYVLTSNNASAPSFQAAATIPISYTSINHASSPYTVLSTDYYISADVTAGVITVLLPNAPTTGRVFVIKDKVGLAATSNITVTTVGGAVTIDGSTSFIMNAAYESVSVIFNGSNYEVW